VIIARIRNEEKVLQRDLPGYSQYMQTTRFRVVPGVW
jgi:protein-S-isoprenylcysteine O-methyltransferase Ste14